MNNPVLILTYNNLELTKRTVESVWKQDIDTHILFIDNGSTDGTREWVHSLAHVEFHMYAKNHGVTIPWNFGLAVLFQENEHVLCINNDVVLPPWFYRELLSYEVPFITGVAVDDMNMIAEPPAMRMPLTQNPDFSAYLIRKECWQKVGPFDQNMKMYASDCDFHVRSHRLRMPLYKACVPYYHERSSTLNHADPDARLQIETQANEDRRVFRKLYGCIPGEPEYAELFK